MEYCNTDFHPLFICTNHTRGANLNGLDFQYLKEYPDILKYAVLQAAQENLTTFLEVS